MFSTINSWKLLLAGVLLLVNGHQTDDDNRRSMHPEMIYETQTENFESRVNLQEEDISYWQGTAQTYVVNKLKMEQVLNENKAKNIIMFLGDGMSMATVAATRMYMGGEEKILSFEEFQHFGLSKTYCVDRQVADSACTATAYLHGVKANYGTLGINAQVPRYDCTGDLDPTKRTESITKWAIDNCKATGLVTTSRVTHATPAGVYAHTANRDWENDEKIREHCQSDKVVDIARQLIEYDVGRQLRVVMGGGRREFRDQSMMDEEGRMGYRHDGRNLIDEWLTDRNKRGNASFIWTEQAMRSLDIDNTDYLLALFEHDHCMYNIDIGRQKLTDSEPSLSEMTETAIRLLQREQNGYFLFVESARIDMAHHDLFTRKALDETAEFSRTIDLARRMTNESDTLIIVTSDHAHVMSYNGYPARGNDILGLSGRVGSDGLPYTTLSYANGISFYNTYENGQRKDLRSVDFSDPDLEYMSMVPRDSETHGGDDVGVYASGPWSHLFVGNYEQNNIPIAMAFAAKIGPYSDKNSNDTCSIASFVHASLLSLITITFSGFIFLNVISFGVMH